jgi:hypothetical protein
MAFYPILTKKGFYIKIANKTQPAVNEIPLANCVAATAESLKDHEHQSQARVLTPGKSGRRVQILIKGSESQAWGFPARFAGQRADHSTG